MDEATRIRVELINRTRLNTDACIFCGSKPTTDEQLFPDWAHEAIGPREEKKATVAVSVRRPGGTDLVSDLRLPGPLTDWQIKCVCGKRCNGGWMSRLENLAKPIMAPLIRGERTSLSPKDQEVIAVWSVLKAMVAHHPYVSRRTRKRFAATRKPEPQWSVWIGHYEHNRRSATFKSAPFVLGAPGREGRPALPNCHASTQIMNKLLVHVVNCVREDFAFNWRFTGPEGDPLSGNIIPIWPPTGHSIDWPGRSLNVADAAAIASALIAAIERELDSL